MISRLVVLISGSGTNLQAILDSCAGGSLAAQVVQVVSNKKDAFGLERARRAMERAKERLARERGAEDVDFLRAEVALKRAIARIKVREKVI